MQGVWCSTRLHVCSLAMRQRVCVDHATRSRFFDAGDADVAAWQQTIQLASSLSVRLVMGVHCNCH